MGSSVFTFDKRLSLIFVSDGLARTLGLQADEVARHRTVPDLLRASAFFAGEVGRVAVDAVRAAVGASEGLSEPVVLTAPDSSRVFALNVAKAGADWMATCDEVTESRAAERKRRDVAMRDPLTGLANRQLFTDRLADVLTSGGDVACAIMLVDLDRFKTVNDTLGHPIGDALLKLVAKRLLSAVRQSDLVSRLGGDEFGLLLQGTTDVEVLTDVAKRVIDLLGRPFLVHGHVLHVGASVGVAVAPRDGVDRDHLVRNADLALYDAKNAGRATFSFFNMAMDERAHARRALEMDLRKALVLREFELHFQPQIDLESQSIVGFEALSRWRHPERGLVSPINFIPLAEEIGLIVPLGAWVLREACREAKRWPDSITIAVNVSPSQFEEGPALLASVRRALADNGLPGRRLELEITENVLLHNKAAVLDTLNSLRAMGVQIAMDDFGTGYSSLSQLHAFPFDKIKIDKSFISGQGKDQSAVVRAIAALGVSLGMTTIAEGVETSEQLARIQSVGCTSVQGYLFSKPIPADQVDAIIAEFAARKSLPHAQAA